MLDGRSEIQGVAEARLALAEMSAVEFLRSLRGLGVDLGAKDGKLMLSAPLGVVTPELQSELRRRKAELMEVLQKGEHAEERVAPLTFAQQRLWLIERFAPENAAYNIPQAWFVDAVVEVGAFRTALDRLAERHAALRTRIEMRNGAPVQVVLPRVEIPLRVVDLTDADMPSELEEALESEIQMRLLHAGREPFALHEAPLIRFQLLMLPRGRTLVSYDVHHIVADQWSLDILRRDLAALYVETVTGKDAELPVLAMAYAEIAERERTAAVSRLHAEQLEYWRGRLAGMPTLLELPFSRVDAETQEYAGATLRLQLDAEVTQGLRQLAARSQTTLYMVMLAAFAALLYRYTGQGDLCVGTPLTGRKRREEENLIGLFVNMLPLRCVVDRAESLVQLLKRMSGQVLADFEHGDLPFQKLVMELHPHRSPAHSPLFQVMFALTPRSGAEDEVCEETFLGIAKFDLTLQIAERARTMDVYLEYRTDLYGRGDMEQFGRHFVRLARSIAEAPESAVAALPLLTAEDAEAFGRWNATGLAFDRGATLVDLFEAQAAATPDAIALRCGEAALSYGELKSRVEALARRLTALGAGPERFVGLCMERSTEMIVAMLAILKSGAAYLPLDPKYPLERLKYMLEDSGAAILVAQRSELSAALAAHCDGVRVLFGDEAAEDEGLDGSVVVATARPVNAAYLIYTSGSTGKPKGVVVEHRNAVALMAWARECFDADALRGMLASTSICFDLSVFEIFLPLATGNTIVLMKDVLELASSPQARHVTLVNTVPSAMSALLQAGLPATVSTVCLAGEFLAPELVERIYDAGVERVFDLYGPTETTTYSTCVLRMRGEPATIGGPIANTRIYLLDDGGKQVPPGAAGEIFIGGEGVTRGYLGRPELTDERFVRVAAMEPEGRLYRTGDMARQRQDGSLVFLGRRDQQIKLRGHRIELGEIEAALREVSGRTEVAVVVQAREAGDVLVAYVEERADEAAGSRVWMEALKKRLPSFMVPAAIAGLSVLPRTPNGKIDRQALRQRREQAVRAANDESPRDLLEQWLANIWACRLGVPYVARNAHFFEDLGGHSLAAFEIFAEIEARVGVAMLLATLFQAPTVAQLAVAIRRQGWKEPEQLRLLMAGSRETARVVYALGAVPTDELKALREDGERVMMLAVEKPFAASAPLGGWAGRIALVEATRPALVLCARRAEEGVARRLKAELMEAGLASVTLHLV